MIDLETSILLDASSSKFIEKLSPFVLNHAEGTGITLRWCSETIKFVVIMMTFRSSWTAGPELLDPSSVSATHQRFAPVKGFPNDLLVSVT